MPTSPCVCFASQATKCPRIMVHTTEVACVHLTVEPVGLVHVSPVVMATTTRPRSFEELCANVDRVAVNGFRVHLCVAACHVVVPFLCGSF